MGICLKEEPGGEKMCMKPTRDTPYTKGRIRWNLGLNHVCITVISEALFNVLRENKLYFVDKTGKKK